MAWLGLALICWFVDLLIGFVDLLICWFADLLAWFAVAWLGLALICWFVDLLIFWFVDLAWLGLALRHGLTCLKMMRMLMLKVKILKILETLPLVLVQSLAARTSAKNQHYVCYPCQATCKLSDVTCSPSTKSLQILDCSQHGACWQDDVESLYMCMSLSEHT